MRASEKPIFMTGPMGVPIVSKEVKATTMADLGGREYVGIEYLDYVDHRYVLILTSDEARELAKSLEAWSAWVDRKNGEANADGL